MEYQFISKNIEYFKCKHLMKETCKIERYNANATENYVLQDVLFRVKESELLSFYQAYRNVTGQISIGNLQKKQITWKILPQLDNQLFASSFFIQRLLTFPLQDLSIIKQQDHLHGSYCQIGKPYENFETNLTWDHRCAIITTSNKNELISTNHGIKPARIQTEYYVPYTDSIVIHFSPTEDTIEIYAPSKENMVAVKMHEFSRSATQHGIYEATILSAIEMYLNSIEESNQKVRKNKKFD